MDVLRFSSTCVPVQRVGLTGVAAVVDGLCGPLSTPMVMGPEVI
jgi:hypothetical protein